MKEYRVGLVGNPNVGKTTVYNGLTGEFEKVGNWHGVTVEARRAPFRVADKRVELVDLPGIYSLSSFSFEEKIAEDFVTGGEYDLIVNVAEASNLERNLLLTRDLLSRGARLLLAVNMADELEKRGGKLDAVKLSRALGVPVIAMNANDKRDVERLRQAIGYALKSGGTGGRVRTPAPPLGKSDFDFVRAASAAFTPPARSGSGPDSLLLNPFFALPCFALVLALVFALTFGAHSPGALLTGFLSDLFSVRLAGVVRGLAAPAPVVGFLADGLCAGLGSVLSFLPQIAILYFCISFLEETGYLSRVAFVTDGIFQKIGLNGRAAFSAVMGLGCTAAAALTARGLDNENVRKKTVLMLPFISCSARMPVYMVLVNAFFAKSRIWVLLAVYAGGIALSLLAALLLDRTKYGGEGQPFLMELPPYRMPSAKRMSKLLLYSCKQFIIKVGTVVLALVAALWFLRSFSPSFRFLGAEEIGESILARLGGAFSFLFYPMGIEGWEIPVAAIGGIVAKEAVAGTLALVFPGGIALSAPSALAFLAFVSLYTPCVAALAAMRREIGLRLTLISAGAQLAIALAAGYLVYGGAMLGAKLGHAAVAWGAAGLAVLVSFVLAALSRGKKKKCRRNCRGCGGCG